VTVRIANPNAFPLRNVTVSLTLPRGVALVPGSQTGSLRRATMSARVLTWRVQGPLAPLRVMKSHVIVRPQLRPGMSFVGRIAVTWPNGTHLTSDARAAIAVVRRPRAVTITLSGSRGDDTAINARFIAPLPGGRGGRAGTIVVALPGEQSLVLRPTRAVASAEGAPARLAVGVTVASATGVPDCLLGTSGTLRVVDYDALDPNDRTRDVITLLLPKACIGATRTFADAGQDGRASVSVAFR
jgi:hypothetical protein